MCQKNFFNNKFSLIYLCVIIIILLFVEISGYNFDTNRAVIFNDPNEGLYRKNSYFGYSVALYASQGEPYVLIGAPRANTSRLIGIKEPGAVYYCGLSGFCKEWAIDNSRNGGLHGIDYVNQVLDEAWIGGAISVEAKESPRVMVCAPKWKNILNNNPNNLYMNGMCYYTLARDNSAFQKPIEKFISPLKDRRRQIAVNINKIGYYYYGMGQFGFSLHSISGEPIWDSMVGAPGTYNWDGTPALVMENSPGQLSTFVPEDANDDTNFGGYSVTSGFYFDSQTRWYVASAPRTRDTKGLIKIFQYNGNRAMKNVKTIGGTQNGEYFGASVTTCDINKDGIDELIVGAPLWSKDGDEGRIYVISARKKSNGFDMISIDGTFPDARFGSTVVCLGDLDHDGYQDVAVGAPYEANSGSVYIFKGSRNGLTSIPTQKFLGKDFGRLRGFGFAISEPRDIDDNGYVDFAVGAHASGHVVLFRAQPVVEIQLSLAYVDSARLNSNTTAFSVKACGYYDGYRVPPLLRVKKTFIIDETHHRAKLGHLQLVNGSYQMEGTLHWRKRVCDDIPVILTRGSRTDPIDIAASLILLEQTSSPDRYPVINKDRSKTEATIQLPFDLDCGSDSICHANLTSKITTTLGDGNDYVIGGDRIINVTIDVTNTGEPAYRTQVHILLPEFLGLASAHTDCLENPLVNGSMEVICEIGNPLREKYSLTLQLDMSQLTPDSPLHSDNITVPITLSTQSTNINEKERINNLTIKHGVEAELKVIGRAKEDTYSLLNTSSVSSRLDSIQFIHTFDLQKFGITPIQQAAVTLLLPTHFVKSSTNKVEIARINSTTLKFWDSTRRNQNDYVCEKREIPVEKKRELETRHQEVFESVEGSLRERAMFLNCENVQVECVNITCLLDVPKNSPNSSTVAEMKLIIDLELKNITDDIMGPKDIIYFFSNGSSKITHPARASQQSASFLVSTKFLGSPVASPVAIWVIAVSVILGIILLALLILALVKFGFFNRKQKEELEALKAESDQKQGIVIETTSSRECLDQN